MYSSQRLVWVDLIKVIAIFLVVLLHASAAPLYLWPNISLLSWMTANIFDSLSRVSVPLFVMASGAVLLGKKEDLLIFFQKRIIKVGIPWLLWTLIYIFWYLIKDQVVITTFSQAKSFFATTALGGFWFLVMLFELYLLTPVLRIIAQHAKRNEKIFAVGMWMIFCVVLHWRYPMPLVVDYIGYFLLGFWMRDIVWQKKIIWVSACCFGVSFLVTIFGTWFFTSTHHQLSDPFYEFLSPNIVIMSLSGFVSLQYIGQKMNVRKGFVTAIANLSFGIYLLHVIILETLRSKLPAEFPVLVLALVTYLISGGAIFLLQKSKILRFLAP